MPGHVALSRKRLDRRGTVEVLINVAVYFPVVPYTETMEQLWDRVIVVHLSGAHHIALSMLALTKDRHWGRIINYSSASTYEGAADQVPYVAAKAGVVGLSRSLARVFGTLV